MLVERSTVRGELKNCGKAWRVTIPVNAPRLFTVIVEFFEVPCGRVRLLGFAVIV